MKDKLKQYNWYKIGFLSVCGIAFIALLYLAYHGSIDRAHAFVTWMNGGMTPELAQCSMFASEHLLEVER